MTTKTKQLQDVEDYYLRQTDGEPNIFQVWEDGGARGDSVTPSTYSNEYRTWMCDKLVDELTRAGDDSGLLSLGCGNAAVEREIAQKGHRVLCVDAIQEAVVLARRKGLNALRADITVWEPERYWSVVYLDGVFGHLYTEQDGLRPIMARLFRWLSAHHDGPGGVLVASNDSTRNGEHAQAAPGVAGFHWLNVDYLREEALAGGFPTVETEEFHYDRPKSGDRTRSIIVARTGTPS